jgi:hypothetical protein
MEQLPSFSSWNTKHNHLPWHFAVATSVILSGCLWDATFTNQAPTWSTTPPKIEKKSLEQIESCSKRIIEHIAQEISSNPKFQSLQYIKSYVADELRKSWFSSAIVSARIFPFIPNDQGTWDYLSIQVYSPEGTTEVLIGTDDRENTLPIIEMIITNFEHAVQQQALHAFAEGIKNNDDFSMGTLYREIHTKLSEKWQTFTQHGFEYRGIEFDKDPAWKCIINVKVYDAVNEREVIIPIETDTELEIKTRKHDDDEPRETMIA